MDLLKTIAYMGLWSVGFIAVHSLTQSTMMKVQNFVGGQGA